MKNFSGLIVTGFLILCSSSGSIQDDIKILWHETRLLEFSDFQMIPPPEKVGYAAVSFVGVMYGAQHEGNYCNVFINAFFDKSRSWLRSEKETVLSHEQCHFDLAEYHARRFKMKCEKLRYVDVEILGDELDSLYQVIVNDLEEDHKKFDQAVYINHDGSRHEINLEAQKMFVDSVKILLNNLERYNDTIVQLPIR